MVRRSIRWFGKGDRIEEQIAKKSSLTTEEKHVYAARERIFVHLPWRVAMPSNSGRVTGVW